MSDQQPAYDGFISYSHAADDLLAPRLQNALQRYAKPWWQRRAMRLFRDESSLSANPHLWSSITEALDTSGWFILLLSPDAAQSEWVNQEIDYWIANRDPSKILPVVTDGNFAWNEHDVTGYAVPPSLRGVFTEEPRWVDLRFANSDEQLDLQNPQFANAVADLASAIRGIPKEDLASEDVRIHRRTIRTAWAAGLLLTALTITAVAVSIQSNRNANEAERLAGIAENQTRVAEDERREAERQRDLAEQAATLAGARELLLQAENQLATDPELSTSLALHSIDQFKATGEAIPAAAIGLLRAATAADHTEFEIPGGRFVAVDPTGTFIATADPETSGVAVWDWDSGTVVEQYSRGDLQASAAEFSPDGRWLAVSYATDQSPSTRLWNRSNGGFHDFGATGTLGSNGASFHPSGSHLVLTRFEGGIEVWALSSLDEPTFIDQRGLWSGVFSESGRLVYGFAETDLSAVGLRMVDVETGEQGDLLLEGSPFPGFASWSPDESRIAVADQRGDVAVVDAATGEVLVSVQVGRSFIPAWSADGESLLVGGEAGLRMLNSATGEVTFEFAGPNSWSYVEVPSRDSVIAASFASDETTVYSLSQASARNEWESDVEGLWRISFIGGTNRIIASSRQSYVVTDLDSESRTTVQESNELFWFVNSSQTGEYVATPTADRWELRDARTGETLYVAQDGYRIHGVAPDGSSVVILREGLDGCDDTALVDIDSGTIRHEWNMGCAGMATYSHAGDLVAIGGRTNPGMTVFDTVSGDQIVSLTGTEYDSLAADFSTDGSLMLAGSFGGSAYVFDVAKLRAELPLEEALVLTLPAHDSLILQAMFSPDGSLIATAAIGEEPAKLWDLASGELLGEFGGTITGGGLHAVDFHPTEPLLAVTTPPSQVAIHSLDTEALIATAKASLSHRMTEDECQTYLRRSCSTDD